MFISEYKFDENRRRIKNMEYRVVIQNVMYSIPVMIIAVDRAEHYSHEVGGSINQSLDEDTIPLFLEDKFEISDWAKNNMNWEQVSHHATKIGEMASKTTAQDDWVNGEYHILEENK